MRTFPAAPGCPAARLVRENHPREEVAWMSLAVVPVTPSFQHWSDAEVVRTCLESPPCLETVQAGYRVGYVASSLVDSWSLEVNVYNAGAPGWGW